MYPVHVCGNYQYFWLIFLFLTNIFISDQDYYCWPIFYFWPRLLFLTTILFLTNRINFDHYFIFDQYYYFWPKFWFFSRKNKIWVKISNFWEKVKFFSEKVKFFWFFPKNFHFLTTIFFNLNFYRNNYLEIIQRIFLDFKKICV